MNQLTNSELIVNNDGSVYHLGIRPEHLSETVITVGDPERVASVTQHFDEVYFSIQNREFKTSGGRIGNKEITVLSTGIGTDNVDIVFNELAFLLNYDLKSLKRNPILKGLEVVRLGTSGTVSAQHPMDSIVYSKAAISFEDLFQFYTHSFDTVVFDGKNYPVIPCDAFLEKKFANYAPSLTLTAKGFYGPQFRNAQIAPKYGLEDILGLSYGGRTIGNIEMETAGIYGLSSLLGFKAISINALLADRLNGTFSKDPAAVIDRMIIESIDTLCS